MSSEFPRPSPLRLREQLRDVGLFGGMTDEAIDAFAAELSVRRAEPGEFVLREGEYAREMFVVLGGELEVLKRGPSGNDTRVSMLGPGDWVGEMSIVDVMPRSASVRALAPSLLLRIDAEDFDRLYRNDLKSYALFVFNIAREMSRRLRVSDGIVANLLATVNDTYLSGPRLGGGHG